jgi:tetratricopeptide (TPR) repeat protein
MEPALESDFQKALSLVEHLQYEEALSVFKRIHRLNLDRIEECAVLVNEAKCLSLLGRFSEARSCLECADRLNTDHTLQIYIEFVKVNVTLLEGRPSALAEGQAFLDRYREQLAQPEYADMLYDLTLRTACELVNLRRFEEGVESLVRFLPKAKEEDKARVYLFVGIARDFLNRTEEAIADFNRVLQYDPPKDILARAHYHLGILYAKVGSLAWAKQHLEQAYEFRQALKMPLEDLYISLISVCEQIGDLQEAERFRALSKSKI